VTLGLLYPTRRMLPPRAKAFIDLAVEELRRHLSSRLDLIKSPNVTTLAELA
jgi:hypothetical protein